MDGPRIEISSQQDSPFIGARKVTSAGLSVFCIKDAPLNRFSYGSQIDLAGLSKFNSAEEIAGRPVYRRVVIRTQLAEYSVAYNANDDAWYMNGPGYKNQGIDPSRIRGSVGSSFDVTIPFSETNVAPRYSDWSSQRKEYQIVTTPIQSITFLPSEMMTIPDDVHVPDIIKLPNLSSETVEDRERVEEFMAAAASLQEQLSRSVANISLTDDGRMALAELAKNYHIELIGSGRESLAFASPVPLHGKDAVMTLFWGSQPESRLKTITLAHKLLSLMFPENFPNIEGFQGVRQINGREIHFTGTIRDRVASKANGSSHYREGNVFAHDRILNNASTVHTARQGIRFPFRDAVRKIIELRLPIDRIPLADVNPNNYSYDPKLDAERFLDLVDLDYWFGDWRRYGGIEPPKPPQPDIQGAEDYMREQGRLEADIAVVKRLLTEELSVV